jgi:hypothetical protein
LNIFSMGRLPAMVAVRHVSKVGMLVWENEGGHTTTRQRTLARSWECGQASSHRNGDGAARLSSFVCLFSDHWFISESYIGD